MLLGMQILQAFGIFALIFKAGGFFQKVQDIERRVTLIECKDDSKTTDTSIAVIEDKLCHLEGAIKCPATKAAITNR